MQVACETGGVRKGLTCPGFTNTPQWVSREGAEPGAGQGQEGPQDTLLPQEFNEPRAEKHPVLQLQGGSFSPLWCTRTRDMKRDGKAGDSFIQQEEHTLSKGEQVAWEVRTSPAYLNTRFYRQV